MDIMAPYLPPPRLGRCGFRKGVANEAGNSHRVLLGRGLNVSIGLLYLKGSFKGSCKGYE